MKRHKMNKLKLLKLAHMLHCFSEVITNNGALICDSEIAVGSEVFVEKDGELIPAPDGQYQTEKQVITVATGVVTEIKEIEEKPIEEQTEETTEENTEETHEEETHEEETHEEQPDEKDARIAELEGELETANNKIKELEAEIERLKNETPKSIKEEEQEEYKRQAKQTKREAAMQRLVNAYK